MAKKSFRNFLIGFDQSAKKLSITLVSDSLQDINATLQLRLIDFEGNLVNEMSQPVKVSANGLTKLSSLPLKKLLKKKTKASEVVMEARLLTGDQMLAENLHYFAPFKSLDLPSPDLNYAVAEEENSFTVTLQSKRMAKDVYLATGTSQNFSDNYFDLLPGTSKTVTVDKGDFADMASFQKALKVMSLRDTYE